MSVDLKVREKWAFEGRQKRCVPASATDANGAYKPMRIVNADQERECASKNPGAKREEFGHKLKCEREFPPRSGGRGGRYTAFNNRSILVTINKLHNKAV